MVEFSLRTIERQKDMLTYATMIFFVMAMAGCLFFLFGINTGRVGLAVAGLSFGVIAWMMKSHAHLMLTHRSLLIEIRKHKGD